MTDKLLKYFNEDVLAATTWENKYAKRDNEGNVVEETPDDMHKRMAKAFAKIEKFYDDNCLPFDQQKFSKHYHERKPLTEKRIFELFKNFKYIIPAGSVMANLGTEKPVSLSNCFVLPSPKDSYSSIMITRLNQVELMKRRGGVGYDLSNLRPRGAEVNNAAITSTGAASFMDVCSDVTNEVAQQGRRGALMISMNVNHPDIEEFIEKKQDLTKVTGANVSVQVTDDFMKAVEENAQYALCWPVEAKINWEKTNEMNACDYEYNKLYKMLYTNEHNSELRQGYMKIVKAKDIWDKIIHCAWNTAEPGVMFKDRMTNFAPDGCYEKYRGVGSNPCSEIFMSGNESCRLIAINLLSFIDKPFTNEAKLNVNRVYDITYDAMRLGDDLVDLENEAVKRILDVVRNDEYAVDVWKAILEKGENGRRCGLEFTALSDMCAAMGYKFCTKESNKFVENVCRLMMSAVIDCQIDMAMERGTFPDYDVNVEGSNEWYKFISREYPERYLSLMLNGRRNISFTTAGPTGCCDENEIIKMYNTTNLTFKELFKLNNIDIETLKEKNLSSVWFEPTDDFYVNGINNSKNKITKLFWRGKTNGKILKLSNGQTIKCSNEHKFLVKRNNGELFWVEAQYLTNQDKILKLKK